MDYKATLEPRDLTAQWVHRDLLAISDHKDHVVILDQLGQLEILGLLDLLVHMVDLEQQDQKV